MADHDDLSNLLLLLKDPKSVTAELDEARRLRLSVETQVSAAKRNLAAVQAALQDKLADRETQLQALQDNLAAHHATLDAQRPLLAEQLGCASKFYDEVRQLALLVDADAAGALPDSVFVWKAAGVEESLRVKLEETRVFLEDTRAAMALHKVARSTVVELEGRVDELVRETKRIRADALLRSALQANTTTEEVLKVAEDGLREAGIDQLLSQLKDRDEELHALQDKLAALQNK